MTSYIHQIHYGCTPLRKSLSQVFLSSHSDLYKLSSLSLNSLDLSSLFQLIILRAYFIKLAELKIISLVKNGLDEERIF